MFFFFGGRHKCLEKTTVNSSVNFRHGVRPWPGSAQPAAPRSGGQSPAARLCALRSGHRDTGTGTRAQPGSHGRGPAAISVCKVKAASDSKAPRVKNLKVARASSSRAGAAQPPGASGSSQRPLRGDSGVPSELPRRNRAAPEESSSRAPSREAQPGQPSPRPGPGAGQPRTAALLKVDNPTATGKNTTIYLQSLPSSFLTRRGGKKVVVSFDNSPNAPKKTHEAANHPA